MRRAVTRCIESEAAHISLLSWTFVNGAFGITNDDTKGAVGSLTETEQGAWRAKRATPSGKRGERDARWRLKCRSAVLFLRAASPLAETGRYTESRCIPCRVGPWYQAELSGGPAGRH